MVSPFKSAYVAAEHGLLGLVKTLALEGADQGVTAIAVCPGYVRTPLVENQVAAQAQAHGVPEEQALEEIILAPHAVKRLIEPDEVADVVAFLLGPTGRTFTGAAVSMDQGWTGDVTSHGGRRRHHRGRTPPTDGRSGDRRAKTYSSP